MGFWHKALILKGRQRGSWEREESRVIRLVLVLAEKTKPSSSI